jgi:hypothetical protein
MTRHVPDEAEQTRYRGYIMDALALAGSFEEQLAFRARVPIANASAEVIEKWSDVYHDDAPDYYTAPVFSDDELQAMREFNTVWLDVCARTPKLLPPLEELFASWPEWSIMRDAANKALLAFDARARIVEL